MAVYKGRVSACRDAESEKPPAVEVQCCKMVDGVMRLYADEQSMDDDRPAAGWPCPSREAFIRHRKMILDMVHNGPLSVQLLIFLYLQRTALSA